MILQAPAYTHANNVKKHSRIRDFIKTWSLALLFLLVNIVFHISLWYFNNWQPIAIISFLTFFILILPFQQEKEKKMINNEDYLIKDSLSTQIKNAKYSPNKYISRETFKKSMLLNNVDFQYSGKRLIEIKPQDFSISNIKADHLSAKDFDTPIFEGAFLKMDFPYHCNGYIIIFPSLLIQESNIPEIFQKLYRRYVPKGAQRVFSENKEFDDSFEIYTNCKANWEKGLKAETYKQLLYLNHYFLDIIKKEKASGKPLLFTEHSLLQKSPLEISIIKNQLFIGIKNLKFFNTNNEQSEPDVLKTIIESVKTIQYLSSLQLY